MALNNYYYAVTIEREVETVNGFGGVEKSYTTHLTTTGLINAVNLQEQTRIADIYQVTQAFNFYTATGQDIKQDDKVIADGKEYIVFSNPKDTVGRGHHYKFLLRRLDNEV